VTSRSFLTTHALDGGLLQSDEWAALQTASKRTARAFRGEGFEGSAFQHTLPFFGNYLFIPRGPVIDPDVFYSEALKKELVRVANSTGSHWLRVEPQTAECLEQLRQAFGETSVVLAPHDINPRETLVVSLAGDISDWLGRMKSKTRYNVRLAEKHGVTIRFSRASEDLEAFIDLIYATTNRKAIMPHPKFYYRNFLSQLPEEMCTVAIAEYNGTSVAAALLVFFGGTAYYLHGGSSDHHRELMAPFLLHFQCMGEAKRRGALRYDFGGVRVHTKNGVGDTGWDGITRFKQGFDPKAETLVFPGTYDIVLSPVRYACYRQSHRLQGIRRVYWTIRSLFSI
jgi:lipid II:glycine glycyltransferase (peptidoglycan interpeptide bridge formation enzyme)